MYFCSCCQVFYKWLVLIKKKKGTAAMGCVFLISKYWSPIRLFPGSEQSFKANTFADIYISKSDRFHNSPLIRAEDLKS